MSQKSASWPETALLLACASFACAPPPADVAPIRRDSPSRTDAAASETLIVHRWIAGCGTGDDLWRWRDSTTVQCDEGGIRLKGTQGSFEWPVDLSASQIDESIVVGKKLDDISFQFWWSAPDESFTAARSAMAVKADAETIRFELADRPGWRGPLRRFRLSWTGTPSPGTWLASIRFEASRGNAE